MDGFERFVTSLRVPLARFAGRALAVALVVAVGTGLALVFAALHERSIRSHEQVADALTIVSDVRQIDGLEWRAIAGQDPEGIAVAVAAVNRRLKGHLEELGEEYRPLLIAVEEYTSAMSTMLAALSVGNRDSAEEIDESEVDPSFERTIALADAIVERETDRAERTEARVRALIWVSALSIAVLLGVTITVGLLLRRRRLEREQRRLHDRRLRALVDRSADVITVVTDGDDLTVLSSGLGALEDFARVPEPTSVRDLLPEDHFAVWKEVDRRLREGAQPRSIELAIESPGARRLILEARGSRLETGTDERVWVWRDITQRKELELQLTHQALHDPLTGVANRSLLLERIAHELRVSARSGVSVGLLFCDLDNFKAINDSLGHTTGDELLRIVTQRILGCIRETDTVARIGGDEFAVLVESDLGQLTATAERLLDAVAREVTLGGYTVVPSVTIGIATAVAGATPEQMLQWADLAMYEAKQAGKGQVKVFDHQMRADKPESLELLEELRLAVAREQLVLHYQPNIDLMSGRVVGIEALVRWQHPRLGTVAPDVFIPLAEASGLILEIGQWVIEEACRAGAELQRNRAAPLYVSVNLSPQQLHSPTIVSRVEEALNAAPLKPRSLVLEITEGILLDAAVAIRRLRELSELGVRIAIDDFGTGYTSVHYLQTLPVDVLKIDRSFISGNGRKTHDQSALIRAIVGLASTLQLRSVAEGIEHEEQLEQLRELGCEIGQGYHWSPPVQLDEASAVISNLNDGPTPR